MKRNRHILNQFKRQRPLTYRIYDFLKKKKPFKQPIQDKTRTI